MIRYSAKPFVSIVVASYNRKDILEKTLNALLNQSYPSDSYEILFVDNASSDDSVGLVNKKFKNFISEGRLKVLALEENSGSSGSYVRALDKANKDWVYMLKMDEDMILDKFCLQHLVDVALKYPRSGMIGGKIFYLQEPKKLQTIGSKFSPFYSISRSIGKNNMNHQQFNEVKEFDGVSGCMFLVSRALKEEVGWFDEDYFLYYDDHDLMFRALKAGYKNYFSPLSFGFHDTSTGDFKKFNNVQWLYYSSRGGWMFFHKNFKKLSLAKIIYFLAFTLRSILNIIFISFISGGKNYRNLIKAYLSGSSHGLRRKTSGRFNLDIFKS